MNASSGQNLSELSAVHRNHANAERDTGGALDNCQRHALFVRTNVTRVLGRERPPPTGPWGEEGGSQMGVAHAPLVAGCDADTGTDQTRAA
jgi:hypothetical protein